MSFDVISKFEDKIAEFFGAPYAVAVDCCTHGIELCLRDQEVKSICVPKRTYISVPFLANKLNIELQWKDENWEDFYFIGDTNIIDAAVLWDVLLHDLQRGVWANEQTLLRYEHQRKGQNDAMMHSMSAIGWLESSELFPFVWARNFGLKQVEQFDWFKDRFMQQANGLGALKQTRYAC